MESEFPTLSPIDAHCTVEYACILPASCQCRITRVFTLPFDPHLLMHSAALMSFAAMAFRDQLKLRTCLLLSIILSMLYHLAKNPGPAWEEVFWNIITFGITLKVLVQLILDRTHIGLSPEEEDLFSAFGSLTPGEFRDLLKAGHWRTADESTALTREGERPDHLYYVLSGRIQIVKGERVIDIDPRTFIGEVAFLHRSTASATVRLSEGARYVEWPADTLDARMGARASLKTSLLRVIGLDMALKVARS